MANFGKYGKALINSICSFIVLFALVQLIAAYNWKLVLDYYLVSNFLLLNPFNMMNIEIKKDKEVISEVMSRTNKEFTSLQQEEQRMKRSQRNNNRENDSRDILLNFFLSFMKHCFFIILAPVIFLQKVIMN